MRRGRSGPIAAVGVFAVATVACALILAAAAGATERQSARSREAALIDEQNLRLASYQIEALALSTHALRKPVASSRPAVVLFRSVNAVLRAARADGAARRVTDTRALMGPVPFNLSHRIAHRPWHRHLVRTHTLRLHQRSVYVGHSAGLGMHTTFRHALPAPYQRSDGVYVRPHVALPTHPTIAAVAIRAALKKLGQPYVWAAAGPTTFDCSGLVRFAYGRAGLRLAHYTGTQWNQGRLIPPRSALPGDLVLVGRTLHHVGIYLGAGWMLNAPFTGHYVDVVPVPRHVAGLVRP